MPRPRAIHRELPTERDHLYVLHACWLATAPNDTARWSLWGEDSAAPPRTPQRRRRRPRVQDHPYAIGTDLLADLFGLSTAAAADGTLVLPLPGTSDEPQPSPELIRETITASSGEVRTGAWRVPTLTVDSDVVYAWLGSQSRRDRVDLVAGPALQHLQEVRDFASDLVNRGRLLPTLDPEPGLARWCPVLVGADAAWARVLAAAAPPSLIAAAGGDELASSTRLGQPVRRPHRCRSSQPAGHRRAEFWSRWPSRPSLVGGGSDWSGPAGPGRRECRHGGPRRGDHHLAGRCDRRGGTRLLPTGRPGDDSEDWQLRLGLQDADEPSSWSMLRRSGPHAGNAARTRPATRLTAGDLPRRARQGGEALSAARLGAAHRPTPRARHGHRRGAPLPARGGSDAVDGRLRGAAARLVDPPVVAAGAEADGVDPGPTRHGVGRLRRGRVRRDRGLPLRPRGRRRHPDRRTSSPS